MSTPIVAATGSPSRTIREVRERAAIQETERVEANRAAIREVRARAALQGATQPRR